MVIGETIEVLIIGESFINVRILFYLVKDGGEIILKTVTLIN